MKDEAPPIMSVDEVLTHIQMGQAMDHRGSMHIVSATTYNRLKDAIDHHLKTGDLVEFHDFGGGLMRKPNIVTEAEPIGFEPMVSGLTSQRIDRAMLTLD
jgi:hypothetical protein